MFFIKAFIWKKNILAQQLKVVYESEIWQFILYYEIIRCGSNDLNYYNLETSIIFEIIRG